MLQRKILFFIFLFLSLTNSCIAQIFGGNPAYLKWSQINTDTARIIFPKGLDTSAQRVANIIHELQRNHTSGIGAKLGKIDIVLQNQSTVSNAYVGLGPFRSEFYLFAPQNSFDLGGLNWVDNLALHEYRHVQQYNNFNVGLSKAARVIFGQEGQALANAASVPDWFFEGDAVFNETVLTQQGRGRIPDFFNGYQSLMRSNRSYSFMKLRNGSYRHLVPNHYELGYLLVGYGREKYGADFWRKVTQDAARFKPLFYPLQGALKKYSGMPYKRFVNSAFDYYQNQWQQTATPSINYITSKTSYRSDYKYPYLHKDGSFIVLKRSYRNIPSFYKISPQGNEQKIAVRAIANDDYFSYNNEKIIYSSLKPNVRWGYKEYGDVRLLDIKTGEEQTVIKGQRYFAPDISHNGQFIAVVELASNQTSSLVILNSKGRKISSTTITNGAVFTYPKFSSDDRFIYTAVRDGKGQMALQKIPVELQGKGSIDVLPFGNRIIGFPAVQGDTIFFSSSYKGSDEIWAYIESQNTTYRVATNPTGFYQAIFDKNNGLLVTSAFTADGYRLAGIPAVNLLWQKVNEGQDVLPELYLPNALQQQDNNTLQNIPARSFEVSKYSKSYNLLNFHSWRPYYQQPEFSFTVFGQNILNTLQTEIYYTYNENERSHKVGANAIYGGWYVQPSIGASQTFDRTVTAIGDTTLNELNANIGLTLPLNLSAGRHFRFLTVSSSLNTQQVNYKSVGKKFSNQDFNYLQSRISYSSQIQRAVQHIYARWAQTALLQYRTIINKYSASQFLATGSVYLPGLHVNHNIVLNASYHARDTIGDYFFSNNFPFSRGYNSVDFPRMWKVGVNYHIPLLYPDWGFANLVYFQRVRANFFYDYTRGKSLRTRVTFPFSTAGTEVYFDTRWWNQQNVTFGIRYSRLLDRELRGVTQPNQWEVILPVNLF